MGIFTIGSGENLKITEETIASPKVEVMPPIENINPEIEIIKEYIIDNERLQQLEEKINLLEKKPPQLQEKIVEVKNVIEEQKIIVKELDRSYIDEVKKKIEDDISFMNDMLLNKINDTSSLDSILVYIDDIKSYNANLEKRIEDILKIKDEENKKLNKKFRYLCAGVIIINVLIILF